MASVDVSKLSSQQIAELSCTYAALILHDDDQDITGQKLDKLIKQSGTKVESYWTKMFAKAIQGKDISSFFTSAQASVVPVPVTKTKAVEKPKIEKKPAEEKKPKVQEPPKEDQEDAIGGLFD